MEYLIMMLFNIKENTYHPIFYREHPFPGSDPKSPKRFRSCGHRTIGFKDRKEALGTIQSELIDRIGPGNIIHQELEEDLIWDGEDIPTDNQLRSSDYGRKETHEKV
jgi:hypothetical protein